MDPLKLKKLEKLAKVLDNGDIALLTELDKLEGQIEALQAIVPALREAQDGYTPVKGVDYRDGVDGYTPVKGVDYFDGVNGTNGVDGKDSTVPGPQGPKGDPGESIVGPAGRDGADGFVDEATVAYLEEEVKKSKLDKEAYDRAMGIVDQRTQYLVNKASNLERNKIDGVGVHTITVSDTAPTSPTTNDIWIDTNAYTYRAVTSTYTITLEDYLLDCDGTFTITLPTAVSFTGEYIIKNSGTGIVTVATTGGQTIDDEGTILLNQYDSMVVRSDGTNWIIK